MLQYERPVLYIVLVLAHVYEIAHMHSLHWILHLFTRTRIRTGRLLLRHGRLQPRFTSCRCIGVACRAAHTHIDSDPDA